MQITYLYRLFEDNVPIIVVLPKKMLKDHIHSGLERSEIPMNLTQ